MSVHEHNGKVYVDSDFINTVQRKYPKSELKHLGFGEFYLTTPEGKIEFDRMRGEHMDWEGKVGRGHLMYDDSNGKAVEKALKYMKNASKVSQEISHLENKIASMNRLLKSASFEDIKQEVEKFRKLQNSLSAFGASDSEPRWFFADLMEKAVKGESLPEIKPDNWQLYSSESGWKSAAQKLTRAATTLFKKIQKSAHSDVLEASEYYGWMQ
jgi:hypothetical protein